MTFYSWPETRKVLKVGNSFMISIPPRHLERMGLKQGDYVTIKIEGEKEPEITIIPWERDKKRA